jgi:hypothetical protein
MSWDHPVAVLGGSFGRRSPTLARKRRKDPRLFVTASEGKRDQEIVWIPTDQLNIHRRTFDVGGTT